jgi:hypothetical protein
VLVAELERERALEDVETVEERAIAVQGRALKAGRKGRPAREKKPPTAGPSAFKMALLSPIVIDSPSPGPRKAPSDSGRPPLAGGSN